MDIRFERDISQNIGLASWAIWEAVVRFDQEVKAARGLPFPHVFVVLPLVLHRRSAEMIKAKTMTEGSFYRTLTEERGLSAGLQERVQGFANTTLNATNIACAAKLLLLDPDSLFLFPGRKSIPVTASPEAKQVLQAARRIGYWLAITDFPILCNLLRIRF
jgi:hypothetical protein